MIRYTSQNPMSIEEFKTPFQVRLDKNNRWVKLGESIPWDALASIYYRSMSSDMGAPAIDARIVIGAMTRQIILRSEKKEDAAHKDLNDPGDDITMNKLDPSYILCNEPDKVQQRIFVSFFKRGSIIIFSVSYHLNRHWNNNIAYYLQ
jgi:hypothetical protein